MYTYFPLSFSKYKRSYPSMTCMISPRKTKVNYTELVVRYRYVPLDEVKIYETYVSYS